MFTVGGSNELGLSTCSIRLKLISWAAAPRVLAKETVEVEQAFADTIVAMNACNMVYYE